MWKLELRGGTRPSRALNDCFLDGPALVAAGNYELSTKGVWGRERPLPYEGEGDSKHPYNNCRGALKGALGANLPTGSQQVFSAALEIQNPLSFVFICVVLYYLPTKAAINTSLKESKQSHRLSEVS